jgi:hypothetical protein
MLKYFGVTALRDKDIGRFDVAMDDLIPVQQKCLASPSFELSPKRT